MERLIKPAFDGGVPYINQDFYFILQENNLLSYKSFLETINDVDGLGNTGIIIKGVKNVTPVGQQGILEFDFDNSMIYLGGDFLEPRPNLQRSIDQTKFYLVKYEEIEEREKKVSGFYEKVLTKSYFTTTIDLPTNQEYIEIEIKNNQNLCQRYLDRILRYHMTEFGQMKMTLKSDYFDPTGKGFGEMFGFHLCNGQNGTPLSDRKYLIGYGTNSNDVFRFNLDWFVPTDVVATNYSELLNQGGVNNNTMKLSIENLPPHNHGGFTDKADNNLRHSHEIQYGIRVNSQPSPLRVRYARSKKISDSNPNDSYEKFPTLRPLQFPGQPVPLNYKAQRSPLGNGLWDHTQGLPGDRLIGGSITDGVEVDPALSQHKHALGDMPNHTFHPNEPPFVNVIYYEKINPYT
jgi:hypothetical protein